MKKKEKKMGIRINFKAKILGLCLPITIIMVIISWRKTHRLAYGMKATHFLLDFYI